MTDRPGSPDTEPRLPHVEPTGPELSDLPFPRSPALPREARPTLSPDLEAHRDAMRHAPRWGRHLHGRVDEVGDRLQAVELALHEVSAALDIKAGVPALRRGLVSDLSAAMATYVNPLRADNAAIKQLLTDIDSRLRVAEGKIVELQLGRKS